MGGYQVWDVMVLDDDPREQEQAALNVLDHLPEPPENHTNYTAWLHGYLYLLAALGLAEDYNPFVSSNWTLWAYCHGLIPE